MTAPDDLQLRAEALFARYKAEADAQNFDPWLARRPSFSRG